MEKIWYKTEFITKSDQKICIYEKADSLVVEIIDMNPNINEHARLYLNKNETHFLARKLVEMSKDIFSDQKIENSPDCDMPV